MKQTIAILTFICSTGVASLAPQNVYAATILPTGTLTDLGVFAAGNYNITGSGIVDLVGDGSFLMQPDGLPVSSVTAPNYSYFNPVGSFIADGAYGPAGPNAKIGALIGTFSASPTSPTDWFLIGYQTQVTLNTPGHIYASVNDTYYPNNTGFFNAVVSLVPPTIEIAIDIKPGSFPNSINPKSEGKIPVAILSSASFDAPTEVNTAALKFGRTGNEVSLAFCNKSPQDVNGDGFDDLVCHFSTPLTGFQPGDTQGVLTGQTVGGTALTGTDSVRIVP